MNFRKNEDGAALLSVLLLVSVMSAAMVATFEVLSHFTYISGTQSQSYQAREYALAAEIVGGEQALKLSQNQELAAFLNMTHPDQKVSFQIEGGEVTGELIETSNCFNLSSLVQVNNGASYEVNTNSYEQYIRLLNNLGIGARLATSLAAALVDWQDSDERPMSMGAESFSYTQLDTPYRASNQPIKEIEELRLVQGYSEDLIEALKPFACIDVGTMETVVNVNSTTISHAPLLHALLGPSVSQQNIVSVIEGRPANGFDNIARFWNNNLLANLEIGSDIRRQFSIKPQRYKLVVDVRYGDSRVHQESLIGVSRDATYTIISRKIGI